jgi:SAM-dependent methyltransferase
VTSGWNTRSRIQELRGRPSAARILSRAQPLLVPPLRSLNAALRRFTAASHHLQYRVEGLLNPSAEWFDHEVDVHWQWPALGRASFLERGVLSALAIRPDAEVLELCCGDGFNAARFYAGRARRVVAVDHNEDALAHARRRHSRPNIEYRVADVRSELPAGPFDNVIWDSAIHHFTLVEAAAVLATAHRSLRAGGLLSGYTLIEPGDGYEYERLSFSDSGDLLALLTNEFAHVAVVETSDPRRRNLYFFAADVRAALPFPEGVTSSDEAAGVDLGQEVLPIGRVRRDRGQQAS